MEEVTPAAMGALPGQVRVTLPDGERVDLASPRIVNDSLVGQSASGRVAIPVNLVMRLAIREPDRQTSGAARTVFITAGIVLAALVAAVALTD